MLRSRSRPVLVWTAILSMAGVASAAAQDLRIYHIDVDQADATLFVAPNGHTLLVDSGLNGHGSRIKTVMDDAGVSRIDFFVGTHYHRDHIGGIDDLMIDQHVSVGAAFDRGHKTCDQGDTGSATFNDYETALGHRATAIRPGDIIPLDPEMTVTCLAAGGHVIGEAFPNCPTRNDENELSVALLIEFGDFRYFIAGDTHKPTERKIAAADLAMDVNVYQANHHGSDTSSAAELLDDMKPDVVIISNGSHAGHQHPRQVTLDAFAELDSAPSVFQTNRYLGSDDNGGNVRQGYIADPETVDEDGTILVTVGREAETYTVTYREAMSHTFAIRRFAPVGSVVIESLVPNPVGQDRNGETVTLRNTDDHPIPMAGWELRDADGRAWPLLGMWTLDPGESDTIRRNGLPMSLNNDGDEIVLIDQQGTEQDRFAYSGSDEGVTITTGH